MSVTRLQTEFALPLTTPTDSPYGRIRCRRNTPCFFGLGPLQFFSLGVLDHHFSTHSSHLSTSSDTPPSFVTEHTGRRSRKRSGSTYVSATSSLSLPESLSLTPIDERYKDIQPPLHLETCRTIHLTSLASTPATQFPLLALWKRPCMGTTSPSARASFSSFGTASPCCYRYPLHGSPKPGVTLPVFSLVPLSSSSAISAGPSCQITLGTVRSAASGLGGEVLTSGCLCTDSAFLLQLLCLILGPSFIAAAMAVTCKHIVLQRGAEHCICRCSSSLFCCLCLTI